MINKLSSFIILVVICYPVIFLKLDSFHIRWWDESVYAVNAYEMIENGKYFCPYFAGLPDYFNSKPPLLIWIQILFIKFFGYNELTVRMPSALAACFSILIVFHFAKKWFDETTAWLSSLILLCSKGFIGFHTARTGDTDALLAMICLLANIFFIEFIVFQSVKKLLLFFLFFTLAFLTKLYACFIFLPAYFLILLIQKKLRFFLLSPYTYFGVVFFLGVSNLFFLLREKDAPGYIWKTIQADAGRLIYIIEKHSESWYFYFDNLVNYKFSIWFIPLIFGIIISIKKQSEHPVSIFLVILSLIFFLMISISQTKLHWYDAPAYPYLSIISALAIRELLRMFNQTDNLKKIGLLAIIFFYPYFQMYRQSQGNIIPNGEKELESSEQFLFLKIKEKKLLDTLKAYYAHWPGSLLFYKYKLQHQKKELILTKKAEFKTGEYILVSNNSLFNIIKSNFTFNIN